MLTEVKLIDSQLQYIGLHRS